MRIGEVVVCSPPEGECVICPYVGKTATIIASKLSRKDGSTRFKLKLEDGKKFGCSERCLEPLNSYNEKKLKEAGDKLLKSIGKHIAICVLRKDSESLHDLSLLFKMYSGYIVMKTSRAKGFSEEINELCEKASLSIGMPSKRCND
jgi:hypothetical protein